MRGNLFLRTARTVGLKKNLQNFLKAGVKCDCKADRCEGPRAKPRSRRSRSKHDGLALQRAEPWGTILNIVTEDRGKQLRLRREISVLTKVRGILHTVCDESATLLVEPFEIEVLIPEHTRRMVQGKVGEPIAFHTILYIEGGAMVSRLVPRLVGFLSAIDREFFEIFCSVDGVGVRKALRAMVRPVRELARTIEDQDVKVLSTLPGIGEATAERIVAKLRRKVGKFALIVSPEGAAGALAAAGNGAPENAGPDVIRDTYAALVSVGHTESQARDAIDRVLAGKKKFKSVADMIEAIYLQTRSQ
jgi:Holliday junction DNA helicase RuvA